MKRFSLKALDKKISIKPTQLKVQDKAKRKRTTPVILASLLASDTHSNPNLLPQQRKIDIIAKAPTAIPKKNAGKNAALFQSKIVKLLPPPNKHP
jgi:hypothetical protein